MDDRMLNIKAVRKSDTGLESDIDRNLGKVNK
jgi:hypothetical protein